MNRAIVVARILHRKIIGRSIKASGFPYNFPLREKFGERRYLYSVITLFLLALTLWPLPLHAQEITQGNREKPIEITADSLEVLQPNRTATFKGNVRAVQGNMILTANTMTVHYRNNEEQGGDLGAVSKIEADGNVFLTTPGETARGSKGIYNVDKKKLFLLNDVVLTRGENVLKGNKLEYSFATGRSLITGSGKAAPGDGGRVRAVFVPEDKK